MTDIEKNKLAMYESVLLFLSENKEIVDSIKAFNWIIVRLKKTIDEINKKEEVLSGIALEKITKASKDRKELIHVLAPVLNNLFRLACETGNSELKSKTKISQTVLMHMLMSELIEKANYVETLAHKNLSQLRKYGISLTELKEIKSKAQSVSISSYNEEISIVANNVLLTIGNLFADADKLLISYMDNFAEALSENYPDFYDEYKWVRNVENQKKIRVLMEIDDE